MAHVTVYSGPGCAYCDRAKALLNKKGVAFEDINIRTDPQKFDEMLAKSNGRKTIPQIFIGETHVGGSDDLHALESAGKLDAMLAS